MARVPEIVLNSGRRMPVLGMGTAAYPIPPPELIESAVLDAIELGYRHFDSASVYESEPPLGRAVSQALRSGLIESRDELFITSKLWCTDSYPERVVPALRETLRDLGLEYVDLYLVHFPARIKVEKSLVFSSKDVLPLDISGTWQAMEECYRLGLAKSIGVCNFSCKKLDQLLSQANIPPAVNQVEMHPLWQQKKLRDFCKEKGIHVSAYSPLGGGGAFWGSNAVLNSEEINHITRAKEKTIAQVCLRWAFEQGVSFLPKSFRNTRLKENMDLFDWQLSKEESEKLSLVSQGRVFPSEVFVSPNGPYKSVYDFWDGEI